MQFTIVELEREPIDYAVDLPAVSIDFGDEAEQVGALHSAGRAEVLHEHRGPRDIVADIRLRGSFQGEFQVPCARCVEPVRHALAADFDLLFRPQGVDDIGSERAISPQETEIGYYEGGGISLEDVLREQVLLALPARTLCKPDCKGLCPDCGQNRNHVACDCEANRSDPRWSALADLESKLKS
uniref:Protein containing DUF177 n=1 Tax=mine drainage metagenome TaxID=410659 RepID=E6QKU1_9ZZZZ